MAVQALSPIVVTGECLGIEARQDGGAVYRFVDDRGYTVGVYAGNSVSNGFAVGDVLKLTCGIGKYGLIARQIEKSAPVSKA